MPLPTLEIQYIASEHPCKVGIAGEYYSVAEAQAYREHLDEAIAEAEDKSTKAVEHTPPDKAYRATPPFTDSMTFHRASSGWHGTYANTLTTLLKNLAEDGPFRVFIAAEVGFTFDGWVKRIDDEDGVVFIDGECCELDSIVSIYIEG